jgi:patched domain-containing protein
MGSSILLGGLSTFLGVLPLAFSTSTVMHTVFTCLFAMVVLGLAHGLIVLPVLLSFVGPILNIRAEDRMHANVRQKFHQFVPNDEVAAQC